MQTKIWSTDLSDIEYWINDSNLYVKQLIFPEVDDFVF